MTNNLTISMGDAQRYSLLLIIFAILAFRYSLQTWFHRKNIANYAALPAHTRTKSWHIVIVYSATMASSSVFLILRPASLWRGVAGLTFCILGSSFALAALHKLKDQYCEELIRFRDKPLITTGIFHFVRHPCRMGMLLEAVGLSFAAFGLFSVGHLIPLMILLYVRTNEEERMLKSHFRDTFISYACEVPRFNILRGILISFRRCSMTQVSAKKAVSCADASRYWETADHAAVIPHSLLQSSRATAVGCIFQIGPRIKRVLRMSDWQVFANRSIGKTMPTDKKD